VVEWGHRGDILQATTTPDNEVQNGGLRELEMVKGTASSNMVLQWGSRSSGTA
jgi:hypothetical protein